MEKEMVKPLMVSQQIIKASIIIQLMNKIVLKIIEWEIKVG
jgi:hypothetical protein